MSKLVDMAGMVDDDIRREVHDMFQYHHWDDAKVVAGAAVRTALENAVLQIIEHVPACPDRTVAIRKIREARMDCNSAITHGGRH